jgi:hypothetical protein
MDNDTLNSIMKIAAADGADRLLWHMTLLDIQELPEVTPAMVEASMDWRTQ